MPGFSLRGGGFWWGMAGQGLHDHTGPPLRKMKARAADWGGEVVMYAAKAEAGESYLPPVA